MLAFRSLLLLLSLLPLPIPVAQADPLKDLEAELSGTWLAKLEGESRPLVLKIEDLERKGEGVFALDAEFGRAVGDKESVKAEVTQKVGAVKSLTFVTSGGDSVVVTQGTDGAFAGTLRSKYGGERVISFRKISADEYEAVQKSVLNAAPRIDQPASDVPSSCAGFSGGWSGVLVSAGRLWLWVVAVDSQCVARYAYGANPDVPYAFNTTVIKDGVLTVPREKGILTFKIQGKDLIRRYSGTDGESSNMMQKVNLLDGSLGALREAQTADRPTLIRPGPNVPAKCAAFFGTWTGKWNKGAMRQLWLHIFQVDAKCFADYAYTSSRYPPRWFNRAEIKDGYLTFRCAGDHPDICSFERKGDVLEGESSAGGGNPATGVFKKVE